MSVRFEVGGALNHVEDLAAEVGEEVETHEILIIRLLEDLYVDRDIAVLLLHVISLIGVALLEQAYHKGREAVM